MIFNGSRYEENDLFHDEVYDIIYLDLKTPPLDIKKLDGVIYQFKRGDRLDLLAEQFYGDSQLGWMILKANPQYFNELEIQVGDYIFIPNRIEGAIE